MNLLKINLLIFVLIYEARSFTIDDPGNGKVHFEDGDDKTQTISMDENNEPNTVIALISGTKSDPTVAFISGDDKLFGLLVQKRADGTAWEIIATNSIDYEALTSKGFILSVSADAQIMRVYLNINNLDDESPVITSNGICEMEENAVITVDNSPCVFSISDPDGFLDRMTFEIENIRANDPVAKDIFKFDYEGTPDPTVTVSELKLVLQEGVSLDYEKITLYNFNLIAKDSGNNPTKPANIQITVKVKDVADEDPEWVDFFSMATIDEEKDYTNGFSVRAQDGDHEINNEIFYKITSCTPDGYVEIDNNGAITIKAIDRDVGPENEQILVVVVAYDSQDEASTVNRTLTFIVNDIDDNNPKFKVENLDDPLRIDENYNAALDFLITVEDIDMGKNAMFSIALEDSMYSKAFNVIPTKGYQSSSISVIVQDAKYLDFENPDWREFSLKLKSTGDLQPDTMKDELTININLNDLNDEPPQFDQNGDYNTDKREDLAKGEVVQAVIITDKDAGDTFTLQLVGTVANNILEIDADNNIIAKENAFDYEKQTEFYIQIIALDSANNSASAQLHITIIDVNDEDPTITVDTSSLSIAEDIAVGSQLDVEITATDPDQNPALNFTIDWDKTRAVKNSQVVDTVKCINVATEQHVDGSVNAILTVIDPGTDYEQYDALYLYLEVTDHNTEIPKSRNGKDFTILTIIITNVNDNPPYFPDDTLAINRTVSEKAAVDTPLISIVAKDDDGDLDELTFTMTSDDEEVNDWINLNPKTGELTVAAGNNIICDYPNAKWNIDYKVTVTDGKFNATQVISVFIIDQNTADPVMTIVDATVIEDSDEDFEVVKLTATDNDRDAPYNVVKFDFNSDTPQEVKDLFKIDVDSSVQPPAYSIKVRTSNKIKWTEDKNIYNFKIDCTDNPEQLGIYQRTVTTDATIKVIDTNNMSPILNTKSIKGSEKMIKDEAFSTQIEAEDGDSPGPFSEIDFSVTKIEKCLDSNCDNKDETFNKTTLFDVKTDATYTTKKTANIIVSENMESNFGYYLLEITLNDYDEVGKVGHTVAYPLNVAVDRYNFKTPKIIFPLNNARYYFDKDQIPNAEITQIDNSKFGKLHASDEQGDKYDLQFEVVDDSSGLFAIKAFDEISTETLVLRNSNYEEHTVYDLTITAKIVDGERQPDEAEYSTSVAISVVFLRQDTDPIFNETNVKDITIDEGPEAVGSSFTISPAYYEDVIDDSFPKYYLLHEGDPQMFFVNQSTGTIELLKELDYETETTYAFVIRASRGANPTGDPANASLLTVNVAVNNLNDELPKFEKTDYYESMLNTYALRSNIFIIEAFDADGPEYPLEYSIKDNEITGSNDQLNSIPSPFELDSKTGSVVNTFQVSAGMSGYFTFIAQVDDKANEPDTASVKIYIISSSNLVEFRFENTKDEVIAGIDDIKAILDEQYKQNSFTSTVYSTQIQDPNESNLVICPVYFINTEKNLPVETDEVLRTLTNIQTFNQLKKTFQDKNLYLASFKNTNEPDNNMEEILRAWLIGVSVVLGALCFLLLAAFFLKTRSLNQRINNLSNTKFGSQESGLNRAGIAAPNTNKYALEANPGYNTEIETKDPDRFSIASGDSNLIGVEDNPEFSYENINDNDKFENRNGYVNNENDNNYGSNFNNNYNNQYEPSNEDLDDDLDNNVVGNDTGSTRDERY